MVNPHTRAPPLAWAPNERLLAAGAAVVADLRCGPCSMAHSTAPPLPYLFTPIEAPIPAHWSTLLERGFGWSEAMGRAMSGARVEQLWGSGSAPIPHPRAPPRAWAPNERLLAAGAAVVADLRCRFHQNFKFRFVKIFSPSPHFGPDSFGFDWSDLRCGPCSMAPSAAPPLPYPPPPIEAPVSAHSHCWLWLE